MNRYLVKRLGLFILPIAITLLLYGIAMFVSGAYSNDPGSGASDSGNGDASSYDHKEGCGNR